MIGTPPFQDITRVVCQSVTKRYASTGDSVRALQGIDLTVDPGEVLLLVGPSGCGKTTLISIIAGVLRRDAGQCRVFGTDLEGVTSNEAAAFRRRHIGFVFQSFNLIPTLNAVENVTIPLLLQGISRKKAAPIAEKALQSVGLDAHAAKLPAQLSGGQQQRVAMARAIVHRPRLVVCDEPTSALDHRTGQEIVQLLAQLAHEAGTILIIVTHDRRIFSLADRIAQMDDGRIVAHGTSDDFPEGVP